MKVGDKLFVQYYARRFSERDNGGLETITKVGRKWVYLNSGYRFERDAENKMMLIDGKGFSSPGRVWMCEGDYKAYLSKVAMWRKIRERVYYDNGLELFSVEELMSVCRWLRIELGDLEC